LFFTPESQNNNVKIKELSHWLDSKNFQMEDFCKYDGEEFLENVYLGLLKREIDEIKVENIMDNIKSKINGNPVEEASNISIDFYYETYSFKMEDFCKYDGIEFIENIYLGLLKREADEDGKNWYLNELNNKIKTKEQIIKTILFSDEGKEYNIVIEERKL